MDEREAMEHEQAIFDKQERLRMIDRPVTTKRWWRLKAMRVENREGQPWGFIINEPRPDGDDRLQYDRPGLINARNQDICYDGMPAVGRYVSNLSGGFWEVWTLADNGEPICISYERAKVERGEDAAFRMLADHS